MKTSLRVMTVLAVLLLAAAPAAGGAGAMPAARAAAITERVSLASDESEANHESHTPSISADGRYVAFYSHASDLVEGDTNDVEDIFVRDRVAGTTERVSVASDESEANHESYDPSISADGRYVAFFSYASNLVEGDTNDDEDIFVRDLLLGITERVSVGDDESQANDPSMYQSISADGRYVAFYSVATNLVVGDTNDHGDVFVRDRTNETTEIVSLAGDGSLGNENSVLSSISSDGRYVAFLSVASNLVAGDTNNYTDIFVRDRVAGTTELISVASDESQGNDVSEYPSISADGRYVAFRSYASNLVVGDTNTVSDVFVRDRAAGTTERVSVANDEAQGNGRVGIPSISADGRYVAFSSAATNLVVGDDNGFIDVFLRDRLLWATQRISVASDGSQANAGSGNPSASADGRYVAFSSSATDLVDGDTNGRSDVFVRDQGEQLLLIVYLPLIIR